MAVCALITWHNRWKIFNGTVQCRACGVVQLETNKGVPLEHKRLCLNAGYGRPWSDLDQVIAKINHSAESPDQS